MVGANSLVGFFARRSPTARRNDMRELLDQPGLPLDDLRENLREIRWINRGLGWTRASLKLVDGVVRGAGVQSFSYLDVATGSGDLPLAAVRHANRQGWRIDAHALDADNGVLAIARQHLSGTPVTLHLGDARALPFEDGSFDIVTCALALHHFAPEDAALVLHQLARVARIAWIVVDLERGFAAYLGARWLRLLLRNRLTRHDAPTSVLRAYSLEEARALVARAGVTNVDVRSQFPFRLLVRGLA